MKHFNVSTSISGSVCVIECARRGSEAYIDARRARNKYFVEIEVVRSGRVRHCESQPMTRAPERMIELMRTL